MLINGTQRWHRHPTDRILLGGGTELTVESFDNVAGSARAVLEAGVLHAILIPAGVAHRFSGAGVVLLSFHPSDAHSGDGLMEAETEFLE